MRLPPEPVLVAAARWLELLPSSGGIPRAQALLTTHARYSDLTPTQYATGLSWLKEVRLLEPLESPALPSVQILSAVFERAAPPWVQDADRLIGSPDELPSDILSLGAALGLDADAVFEQLAASWSKVDTAQRARVGAAGEEALLALLREVRGAVVDHVAVQSDGYGYDIAYADGTVSAHLEVKSSTRVNRFTAFLSRHEYDVMLRDDHWALVTLRLSGDFKVVGVGSLPRAWIAANVPRDAGSLGRWASVKLEIPADVVSSGIPQLGDEAARLFPAW